jgi:hypothetical protein
VTEEAPLGVAALVLEEVQEWVGLGKEEWVAPEQVQDREENVCVQNVERLLLMKQERRATL